MIPLVQGVGTRAAREVGGQVSNMVISITRVGRMIREVDTRLPRRRLGWRTMLIRRPRLNPTPRSMGTRPVRPLVRHTRVHRRTRMGNNIPIVDMPIHNRPRRAMRTCRRRVRTPTIPQHLIIHSKDNTPLRRVLSTLRQRTRDHTRATMSVRTRTPT